MGCRRPRLYPELCGNLGKSLPQSERAALLQRGIDLDDREDHSHLCLVAPEREVTGPGGLSGGGLPPSPSRRKCIELNKSGLSAKCVQACSPGSGDSPSASPEQGPSGGVEL